MFTAVAAAMALAAERDIATAVWVEGTGEAAAAEAVARVRAGDAEVLLKGALRTDELLRAVLARDTGLRAGRLLSDVLLYEDRLEGNRLVGITDGGITVAPDAIVEVVTLLRDDPELRFEP